MSNGTVENQMYGGNWGTCSRCGVKDRPDQLVKLASGEVVHRDEKAKVCAEWKATLAKARPADITAAAVKLVELIRPTPDELLAQVHAPVAETSPTGAPFGTVTTFAYPPTDKGGK